MNLSVKNISIENRRYYFVDKIMNIKDFDSDNIKIDEKYCKKKKNQIYYIGYVNYSVNPLHLIFRNVNGYFEEINENKYLTLEKIKNYEELWIKIRELIRSITK